MKQFTEPKTIKFTKIQMNSLQILESYGVNISQFARIAISEKLKRDWKSIKENKEKVKLPF
jgi:post-segregation antitoxin (ccd killing protein)